MKRAPAATIELHLNLAILKTDEFNDFRALDEWLIVLFPHKTTTSSGLLFFFAGNIRHDSGLYVVDHAFY